MKNLFLSIAVTASALLSAQTGKVGINTQNPQSTLDVVGVPSDITKLDGIIAPRLTGSQLATKNYTNSQTGAIVYVSTPAPTLTGQVSEVVSPGYYYFDGNIWKSFEDDTLEDVVRRGNHSPKFITFTGGNTGEAERDGALGMKLSTYSYFFGNMNPDHTGLFNASFGYNALANLTTAYYNTAVGSQAGSKTTTGNSNSYFGDEAGYNNTTGYKNAIFGMGAAYHNSTGSFNSIFGFKAGQFRTLGNYNVLIGNNTGSAASPTVTALGNNNVFIGTGAGFGDGNISNKLIIHSNNSLTSTNSIEGVFSNPAQSQLANALVTGDFVDKWFKLNGNLRLNPTYNTSDATYTKSLVAKADGTVGLADIAVSPSAWLIGGNGNTNPTTDFLGTTNNNDIVLKRNGVSAGWLNQDDNNTSFGVNSMPRSVGMGRNNTAIGVNTLTNVGEGNSNVAVGYWSLSNLTTGMGNTAVGVGTMNAVTTGEGNTSIGEASGGSITTGRNNTFVGSSTGLTISTGSQNVQLGPGSLPINNGSNQLVLGHLIFGKDLNAAALLTNGNVPGMVGIATPYPTSTLDTQGSVATRFSSVLIDTTLGEKDHTLLTNNATTITLPDPSTCNGRTYIIIYGSGGTSTISSNIIIGGSTVSNFQINSTAGNRGVNLQSSGSAWYVTNLF